MALAASMAEPPPKARMASKPVFLNSATPLTISAIGASGVISSNTT
jgi:hypothetical protein